MASVLTILVIVVSVSRYIDHLYERVGQLEDQMHSFVASSSAITVTSDRLGGRVNQLEEQVHSMAASSAAMAAAINEVSRKPAVAADPMMQKCVELASKVHTGQRNTVLGSTFGDDVIKNAVVAMEKLGCGSKRP